MTISRLPLLFWLGAAVLVAPRQGHASWRHEGPDTPKSAVRVELEIDKVENFADVLRRRLAHEVSTRISEAGRVEASSGRAKIQIMVSPANAKELGFEYRVSGWVDDEPVDVIDNAGLCTPCMHEEVVDRIDAVLVRQLAALGEVERAPAATFDAAPAPPAPRPPVQQNADRGEERQRLRVLGRVGLGAGGVGLVGIVAGAVMATRAVRVSRDDGDPRSVREVDVRPGGYALLGVGGALFVAGVAMLATDIARGRKRTAARRSVWTPAGDRGGLGVVWTVTF